MYSLEVRESVDRIFSKLAKKNPKQMRIIEKKIKQICEKPSHFKPLRAPMQHLRRVHQSVLKPNFYLNHKSQTQPITGSYIQKNNYFIASP